MAETYHYLPSQIIFEIPISQIFMLARQKQYIAADGKVIGLIEKEKIDSGEIDKLLKEKKNKKV